MTPVLNPGNIQMLCKPILAFCNDRARPAPTHSFSGEPDKWLADTYLQSHCLVGLTFDFFVNWDTRTTSKPLWIKRIVEPSFTSWPDVSHGISNAIYQCDGKKKVKQLCEFAAKHDMTCHYFLFKESSDWQNSPTPIVAVSFGGDGSVTDVREVELSVLKRRIRHWAGGHVPVGDKGLIMGLSTLECYLANDIRHEGVAWPGDADLVLVDSNFTPHAIIEFKKHTRNARFSFSDQKLSNYYWRGDRWSPDGRKYNRLAMLRDHLSHLSGMAPLPIIVVYFPTPTSINEVQLERVEGADRELITTRSEFVPLPKASDAQSCRDFVASLLGIIDYEI